MRKLEVALSTQPQLSQMMREMTQLTEDALIQHTKDQDRIITEQDAVLADREDEIAEFEDELQDEKEHRAELEQSYTRAQMEAEAQIRMLKEALSDGEEALERRNESFARALRLLMSKVLLTWRDTLLARVLHSLRGNWALHCREKSSRAAALLHGQGQDVKQSETDIKEHTDENKRLTDLLKAEQERVFLLGIEKASLQAQLAATASALTVLIAHSSQSLCSTVRL